MEKIVFLDPIGRPRSKITKQNKKVFFPEGILKSNPNDEDDVEFIRESYFSSLNKNEKVVFGNFKSELCTRSLLKKISKDFENCYVGFEVEFYTSNRCPNHKVPMCANSFDDDLYNLWDDCNKLGIGLSSMYKELAYQQFEVTFEEKPVVNAVDELVRFYLLIAEKYRDVFDIGPKVHSDRAASGLHINISFTGWEDIYKNILSHHRELIGFVAPSESSFDRLKTSKKMLQSSCGTGRYNPLRERPSWFEYRLADNTCNPYIAVSALLLACKIEKEYKDTIAPLNQKDALSLMQTSEISEYFPKELIKNYVNLYNK